MAGAGTRSRRHSAAGSIDTMPCIRSASAALSRRTSIEAITLKSLKCTLDVLNLEALDYVALAHVLVAFERHAAFLPG